MNYEIKQTDCSFDLIVQFCMNIGYTVVYNGPAASSAVSAKFMQNIGYTVVYNASVLAIAIISSARGYTFILGCDQYVRYPVNEDGLAWFESATAASKAWLEVTE